MGKRTPAPHAWQVTLHRWWGAGEEGHADADADANADAHRAWQTAGAGAREGAPPTHTRILSLLHPEALGWLFFQQIFFGCDYLFSARSQSVCLSTCAHLRVCACV